MDFDRIVGQVTTRFREAGTPDRAEHEKAYLKSDLKHFGTSVPEIRKAAKGVRREHHAAGHDDLLAVVGVLW